MVGSERTVLDPGKVVIHPAGTSEEEGEAGER